MIYEAQIKEDAKKIFLENARLQRQEQEKLEEDTIKWNIDMAISSKVE